mgnify:CR=1 FL=1
MTELAVIGAGGQYAFAADLLERVKVAPLRDHFEHVLMRTLSEDPNAEETHS